MMVDSDNLDVIEAAAREHLGAARWADAAQLYDQLAKAGRNRRAVRAKLAWRIGAQEQFERSYGGEAHQKRVRNYFRKEKELKIKSVKTRRASVGFVSVAAFVHTLQLRGGAEIYIYEKVFGNPDEVRVANESLLFENHCARSLSAPEFWGSQKTGKFISVFYEYIEGTSVPSREWNEIGRRLIERLWAMEPKGKLLEVGSRLSGALDILDRLPNLAILDTARDEMDAATMGQLVTTVTEHRSTIEATMDRMPKFIFHRDLHPGNVLKSADGALTIIDWEQWSLEPIGFGWMPLLGGDWPLPLPDLERLTAARPEFAGLTEMHLFLMSSLWAFRFACIKRKVGLSLTWLKRLAYYSQQVQRLRMDGS